MKMSQLVLKGVNKSNLYAFIGHLMLRTEAGHHNLRDSSGRLSGYLPWLLGGWHPCNKTKFWYH